MGWYAASAIMYVRFKDGGQEHFPVWENVLLIEASNDEEAEVKARERAAADEGDSGGTFTWEGRPAEWVFAGIRKVLTVAHEIDRLGHGDEVTFSEFRLPDQASVHRLAAGEEVDLKYVE